MPVLENPHYEIFAREIAKGTNNREAYRLAGHGTENDRSADACACRLLAGVSVALRIKEIQERAAKRAEIDIEAVLLELAKIGFANMADYMQAGADGDFSKLTRDQAAALSEVTVEDFLSFLSNTAPAAPQPDTILGRQLYGEGINPHTQIDLIELQPPDIVDRIRRDKNRFEWGPTGKGQGWGSLAKGPPDTVSG